MGRINVAYAIFEGPSGPNKLFHLLRQHRLQHIGCTLACQAAVLGSTLGLHANSSQ